MKTIAIPRAYLLAFLITSGMNHKNTSGGLFHPQLIISRSYPEQCLVMGMF
jgi:hypothetical protein